MNSDTMPAGTTGNGYDVSRRRFLQLAGGVAGAGVLFTACKARSGSSTTYIGSGDVALLNFLFIIEQVQAAFYTQANITPYYGLTTSESLLQIDMRDHEVAHMQFLRSVLGTNAVSGIVTDLSSVTFSDRTNTLSNGIILADMAVAAYNGALPLFTDTSLVPVLAKMAPVDARHSAYLRDILTPDSDAFADASIISPQGLNPATAPASVLATAQKYIQTHLDARELPN